MKKNILIADDRPEIRTLVSITLSNDEFSVSECQSAPEAVKKAHQEHPHLILMDIDMPGKYDGLTATRLLSEHPETAQSPIIILTASKNMQEESLASGAVAYLTKPFSPIDLMETVHRFARKT